MDFNKTVNVLATFVFCDSLQYIIHLYHSKKNNCTSKFIKSPFHNLHLIQQRSSNHLNFYFIVILQDVSKQINLVFEASIFEWVWCEKTWASFFACHSYNENYMWLLNILQLGVFNPLKPLLPLVLPNWSLPWAALLHLAASFL